LLIALTQASRYRLTALFVVSPTMPRAANWRMNIFGGTGCRQRDTPRSPTSV
jgi:hypothetical protein